MKPFLIFLITAFSTCLGETDTARQQLLSICAGEWVSRALYVAAKLEIADHLESGPKSIEELAALTRSNRDSLDRLLQLLTSFGIFEEVSPNILANTGISRLLIKSAADSLHSVVTFYGEDIHQAWPEILPSIQTGAPAFELAVQQPVFSYFKNNPERASLFQKAMSEKSNAVINSALSSYNFGQFHSICDVGGGYGQFIQTLLQEHPQLKGALFDLSEVIEKIDNAPYKLIAGDFFHEVPSEYDAYILKSVLHDWDDEHAERILHNCFKAMPNDSLLLIVEVVNNNPYAYCMDFLMLAITGGKERSLPSMARLLENAGFAIENVYPTSTEFSIIEAKKLHNP